MTALNLNASLANTPSTSGAYTFSVTRDDIIRHAMMDIGALEPYEAPTAIEVTDCAFKLNMLVKQWMGDTDFAPGMKVWTRKRADLFLDTTKYTYQVGQTGDNWIDSTAGLQYPQSYGQTTLTANVALNGVLLPVASTTQCNIGDYVGILLGSNWFWTRITAINPGVSISIPASGLPSAGLSTALVVNYTTKAIRPVKLITAVLRDIYSNDTPLSTLTVERYESLPTKTMPTNSGDPTALLYESQYTQQSPNGQIYLDVGSPQDVTKHIHAVYLAPVQDFLNPGDAPDYPQQWFLPLVLQLGKLIAPAFSCAWTKELEESRLEALSIARQADPKVTDAYFEVNADMDQ